MAQLRLSSNVSPGQTVNVDDAKVDVLMATGLFERVSQQARPPNPADQPVQAPTDTTASQARTADTSGTQAVEETSAPADSRPARPNAARNATQPRQDQNETEANRAARTSPRAR